MTLSAMGIPRRGRPGAPSGTETTARSARPGRRNPPAAGWSARGHHRESRARQARRSSGLPGRRLAPGRVAPPMPVLPAVRRRDRRAGRRAVGPGPAAPGGACHLALDDIALVEQRTAGPVHALTVTARTGTLVVRCDDDQRSRVDAWTGRLRLRVAARSAPLPPTSPYGKGGDLDAFLLAPDDQAVVVGHRGGRLRRCCLLAVTSRELIIEHSWRDPRRPWRQISRTLYLPRQSVHGAMVRGRALRLQSADTTVRVRLGSRKTAATASTWLSSSSVVRGLAPPEESQDPRDHALPRCGFRRALRLR